MKNTKINFHHPEVLVGEVFLSNMSLLQFNSLNITSKRKGGVAFDGEGNQLTNSDWFPIFIKEAEIFEHCTSLSELRKGLRHLLE
jgi:hypothetical protein